MGKLILLKPDFQYEPEDKPRVRRSPLGYYVLSTAAWLLLAVICWALLT
jgi:hypothetical protein